MARARRDDDRTPCALFHDTPWVAHDDVLWDEISGRSYIQRFGMFRANFFMELYELLLKIACVSMVDAPYVFPIAVIFECEYENFARHSVFIGGNGSRCSKSN